MVVRKRFGQHFLHDPAVIRRIVDCIAPARGERIVEIGPGRGALTWALLERAGQLDAIEIDRDLAAQLAGSFAAAPRCALHVGDALQFDFSALARSRGGPHQRRRAASWLASCTAAARLRRSARPLPARSKAVPWSGEVRTIGRPSVTLTARSKPACLTTGSPWS